MSETLDWNAKTIAEFRANRGRVGENFEGAPLVLMHHRGRKSGREYVNPMMYLAHDTEPDIKHHCAVVLPEHPVIRRKAAPADSATPRTTVARSEGLAMNRFAVSLVRLNRTRYLATTTTPTCTDTP
jgi:F420H(2)-dependent quinone reductase